MRKKIAAVTLAGILLFGLNGCSDGGEYVHNSDYMDEWISPDGVHYWIKQTSGTTTARGFMAPRYDHDGNLVIENWDIQ